MWYNQKRIRCYTWAAIWRPMATCHICIQSDKRDTKQVCPNRKTSFDNTVCLWPFPSVHIWKTSATGNRHQNTSSYISKKHWMIAQDSYQGFKCKIQSAHLLHSRRVDAGSRCIIMCSNGIWYKEHGTNWARHWSSGSSSDQLCANYRQKMNKIK